MHALHGNFLLWRGRTEPCGCARALVSRLLMGPDNADLPYLEI